LDQYLTTQPNVTAASSVQHAALPAVLDQCSSFSPDAAHSSHLVRIDDPPHTPSPMPHLHPSVTEDLHIEPLPAADLPDDAIIAEEALDAGEHDQGDADDPLPLPEVHLNGDEDQEFGVEDIDVSIPEVSANDVVQNVSQTETEEKDDPASVPDLEKYLTASKDKKGETVMNFFTKRSRKGVSRPEYCCNVCSLGFTSLDAFYVHFSVHSKQFVCLRCGESCCSTSTLAAHVRTHSSRAPQARRDIHCTDCGRQFTTASNLSRHMRTHTDVRPFTCAQCGKRFREKKTLQAHCRSHSGERPYACSECSARFVQLGALNGHMELHAGIRRHLCDQCGKSFSQRAQLKVHQQRHEGNRNFHCDKCPMAFNVFNDLKRHMRSHTQERPHKCDVCGKAFARQLALSDHMNRHYGTKPYLCQFCARAYADQSAWHKHMKSQHADRAESASLRISVNAEPTGSEVAAGRSRGD